MLFESEWCSDAITAPVLVADDPEDEVFTGLGDRMRSPTDLRPNQNDEAPERCDVPKSVHRRRWIGMLTTIFRRSRMHRRREIERISAAWTMVDDRTLKDIGISRLQVEYARDARHWG